MTERRNAVSLSGVRLAMVIDLAPRKETGSPSDPQAAIHGYTQKSLHSRPFPWNENLFYVNQMDSSGEAFQMSHSKYSFDRYSSIRTAYCPSFSPDNRLVAFVSDITGVPQVWACTPETGVIDQLTLFNDRVSSAHFSPKLSNIIFAMDPGGSERHQLWTLDVRKLEAKKLTLRDDRIYNFGEFSPSGDRFCYASNERDERFFDIYTYGLDDQDSRLLYENDGTNYAVDWLSRGQLVIGRANTNLDTDLYLLDTGAGEPKLLTPHDEEASYRYAGCGPDEKELYVITNYNDEIAQPARIDTGTGEIEIFARDKWDAIGGKISPNGKLLAYFRNVNGASQLHIYNVEGNEDVRVENLPLGALEAPLLVDYELLAWDSDSRFLTFSFQGPRHNLNLWLYDSRSGSVRQLTFAPKAGIPQESLIEPAMERYTSFDGLEIPVLVYTPPESTGPLPTVIYVHGGPESQETARFNVAIQYFVNQGLLVLAPNVRGSTGYGKRWVHLDDVERRLDAVRDLEFLVKWAVGKKLSKSGKIGIFGGSYGGFMVLSAITEFPDLWAAGIDLVGIANFTTFLEKTAKWRRHLRAAEYGDPVKHSDLFKRISPIHNVDKIQAPLLVIHGANDPRVPIREAEQIVGRLKELGRHVEYLRFEDEGHGIAKIPNRVKAYTAIGDFLERTILQ